jgi:hypothetical protein
VIVAVDDPAGDGLSPGAIQDVFIDANGFRVFRIDRANDPDPRTLIPALRQISTADCQPTSTRTGTKLSARSTRTVSATSARS